MNELQSNDKFFDLFIDKDNLIKSYEIKLDKKDLEIQKINDNNKILKSEKKELINHILNLESKLESFLFFNRRLKEFVRKQNAQVMRCKNLLLRLGRFKSVKPFINPVHKVDVLR